jgi:hypothetical protein
MKFSLHPLRQALALLTLLCLTAAATLGQHSDPAQSLLWKVSGNGLKKPSYLYGTFHLVPGSYLPADGKVMAAFQAANGVIVEIKMDSSDMMKASTLAIMHDHQLSQLYAPADYTTLETEFTAATGYPLAPFAQVKPAALSLMLTLAYNQQVAPWLAAYKGAPLDMYFQQEGKRLDKNILALETVEEQMHLLYNAQPVEEQAQLLLTIVQEKDIVREASGAVAEAWRTEDLAAMQAASDRMMKHYGSEAALLDDRNARWMEVLPKAMKKGPQFIAVGALHLAGDKGLIQLLRDKGYSVVPVTGK